MLAHSFGSFSGDKIDKQTDAEIENKEQNFPRNENPQKNLQTQRQHENLRNFRDEKALQHRDGVHKRR
jgi:hypothetical protein